ncbi:MAG: hypothetical protein J0I13_02515 [Rhizobiales bacterium]|nr:hypothetical protein [Hyphomicrobiales bacterium]
MTACPCCNQPVAAPLLNDVIVAHRLSGFEESILRAVWRGKGHPVSTERIFDAMYADDPDGGPEPPTMYKYFRIGLSRLRARLKGTGVSIENAGLRRGFRLSLR